MTYLGYCENGVIKLDDGVTIADGAKVRVEVLATEPGKDVPIDEDQTDFDHYKSIIGKAKGLPADFAAQRDHYIYGTPKRS